MSQTLGWLHGPEFGPIQFRQIKLWVFNTLAMGFPRMFCFPDVEVIPSFALFFPSFLLPGSLRRWLELNKPLHKYLVHE